MPGRCPGGTEYSRAMSSDWQQPPPGYSLDSLLKVSDKTPHQKLLETTRHVREHEALPVTVLSGFLGAARRHCSTTA